MTYLEWLERFAVLTPQSREHLRDKILRLEHRPLISILLPIYNSDLEFLRRAITSVRRQIYENWELCMADDASTDPLIRPFLEDFARADHRMKVIWREQNGHISACSNSALSLARGEWCALLDQDDELAEDALAEVVLEIGRNPEAAIIYSDEDFLDADDVRSNPFLKPDWNPELFMGQNYLNHLGVYRAALLREIGGFREGFEGSQDYDVALRCSARSRPEQIRHIPRILYHWRMIEGSLAGQPDAKPYARHAARRALQSHLEERRIAAQALACPENAESHRVVYKLPTERPHVSIVSTAQVRAPWLEPTDYPVFEFIASEPGAAGANAAAKKAQGDILLFLSGEIGGAEAGWLTEIVSHAIRSDVGAVGARLWSPENTLEDGGLILGLGGIAAPAFRGIPRGHPGYFNRAWLQQDYSAVSVACMAMRKDVFLELNGFDETNLPQHFYDVDFCLRLRQRGFRVVWTPYANLTLRGSGSREKAATSTEAAYMQERWGEHLQHDPFYNRNLSLELPGFARACPPRSPNE